MFAGIKLLCLRPKKGGPFYQECLHPIIVPEDKFLKIANIKFKCPACERENDQIAPYFLCLIKLKKAADAFDATNFYIRNYELAFQGCHADGFEITPHVLQEDDWIHWNMQIASLTIAHRESSIKIDLWEDHNFKARPFLHPFENELTFGSVMKRRALFYDEHEINLPSLKSLIKEIRNYNNAWLKLVDSFVTAVSVDLKHSLYTLLNKVDSLAELLPDDEKYK